MTPGPRRVSSVSPLPLPLPERPHRFLPELSGVYARFRSTRVWSQTSSHGPEITRSFLPVPNTYFRAAMRFVPNSIEVRRARRLGAIEVDGDFPLAGAVSCQLGQTTFLSEKPLV